MLYDFLRKNQKEILALTEQKSLELAGTRPSSKQLKRGLPLFYEQLLEVLRIEKSKRTKIQDKDKDKDKDKEGMAIAALQSDEEAMAKASGRPDEIELAREAGLHGKELLRLGYTLSHVVHAYGAMCQSITELANEHKAIINANEFHDLNRCLDIAIAGAVTSYQANQNAIISNSEVERLGFLAHELRNTLSSAYTSFQLIKRGTVAIGGSTGHILENSLKRLETLIDRSLTEVRLRIEPELHTEVGQLLTLIDQIVLSREDEARSRKQIIDIQIDPRLEIEVDQQLFHSALSNLIQNAVKYTHQGGKIQVRGKAAGENIVIEVEDECGGLPSNTAADLFRPFEQQNENREGLGLGLTIAMRAIKLSHGTIDVSDFPGKGCIFRITLPKKVNPEKELAGRAA